MNNALAYTRRKLRKQVHKYWQMPLPRRIRALDARFLRFAMDYVRFAWESRHADSRFTVRWMDRLACLDDKTQSSEFDVTHVYRLGWAARAIASRRPPLHLDVGSHLALSTLVSAFTRVWRLDDVRVGISLPGLECGIAKARQLPMATASVKSVSCLGLVEHAGLGRFGDPLDPDADTQIMAELTRILEPGASLLLSVPVGSPRIRFNAYRIYSCQQIRSYFAGLRLRQFALVDDDGRFWPDADDALAEAQQHGCGCWWFIR